ncbi:hypothetical protein ABZ953_28785 [Streptomyces sp. NPDC046465]|uniref:hypothetical protein n=1 Tax=Streptomyces sp. NPDC046465 TaxID=3155810 RepID=UPI0033C56D88
MSNVPNGVFRILTSPFDGEQLCLTNSGGDDLTLLPPGGEGQSFEAQATSDGYAIHLASHVFPARYLSYQGAPDAPRDGAILRLQVSEFPPCNWHVAIAPGFTFRLAANGSDLAMGIAPIQIHPPRLHLSRESALGWVFELVKVE